MGLEDVTNMLSLDEKLQFFQDKNIEILKSDSSIFGLKKSISSLKPSKNSRQIILPGDYLFFTPQSCEYEYNKKTNEIDFLDFNYNEPAILSNLSKTEFMFINLGAFLVNNCLDLLVPRVLNSNKANKNLENCGIKLVNPTFHTKSEEDKNLLLLTGFSNYFELKNSKPTIYSKKIVYN